MSRRKLVVSLMRVSDVTEAVEVESAAWAACGDEYQFTREQLVSIVSTYPEGQFIARVWSEKQRRWAVAGFVNTMGISYDLGECRPMTWDEITAYGYITNHDPQGNMIFGVNLTGNPEFPRSGASDALMYSVIRLCISLGKDGVILGARMPGYHKRAAQMTAEEYMLARRPSGKPLDPELQLYESAGGRIIRLVPGYMPDPQSCDNGVLVFYENPLRWARRLTPLRQIVAPLVGTVLK